MAGKKTSCVVMRKAAFGTLWSSPLFHKKLGKDPENEGFVINQ